MESAVIERIIVRAHIMAIHFSAIKRMLDAYQRQLSFYPKEFMVAGSIPDGYRDSLSFTFIHFIKRRGLLFGDA